MCRPLIAPHLIATPRSPIGPHSLVRRVSVGPTVFQQQNATSFFFRPITSLRCSSFDLARGYFSKRVDVTVSLYICIPLTLHYFHPSPFVCRENLNQRYEFPGRLLFSEIRWWWRSWYVEGGSDYAPLPSDCTETRFRWIFFAAGGFRFFEIPERREEKIFKGEQ